MNINLSYFIKHNHQSLTQKDFFLKNPIRSSLFKRRLTWHSRLRLRRWCRGQRRCPRCRWPFLSRSSCTRCRNCRSEGRKSRTRFRAANKKKSYWTHTVVKTPSGGPWGVLANYFEEGWWKKSRGGGGGPGSLSFCFIAFLFTKYVFRGSMRSPTTGPVCIYDS